jgi:hypothetical protein
MEKMTKAARKKELIRLRRAVRDKAAKLAARTNKRRIKLPPPTPYRSWFEVDIAIDALARGIDFAYEQDVLPWVEPAKIRKYNPDYTVEKSNGEMLIVEAKGRWTAADRKKICYVTEQHPDVDLRILFERDNTLSKSPKSKRYSEWCDKKGIKWAVGRTIPEEWLK